MDTSPEYIYELIEKLSWHVCWQGRDHRELRLDVANALRSLLQERDEYKRIAEATMEDPREWELFSLISAVWYGKDAYFRQDDGMVYSRISGEYMTFDQAVDEFVCELRDDNNTLI